MKTYIHKSSREPIPVEDIGTEVFIGETWQDYLDGKWIELSEQQLAFRGEHPEASIKEVFDMQMTPPPQEPIPPTLEEIKAQSIAQVEQAASARMDELFPQYRVNLAAQGLIDEIKASALLIEYENTNSKVYGFLTTATQAIESAVDETAVNAAVETFNTQIYTL